MLGAVCLLLCLSLFTDCLFTAVLVNLSVCLSVCLSLSLQTVCGELFALSVYLSVCFCLSLYVYSCWVNLCLFASLSNYRLCRVAKSICLSVYLIRSLSFQGVCTVLESVCVSNSLQTKCMYLLSQSVHLFSQVHKAKQGSNIIPKTPESY